MKVTVRIDGNLVDPATADLREIEPGLYSLISAHQVYEVRVHGDQLVINGQRVTAEIEDPRQFRAGSAAGGASGRTVLRATMPGKVVRLLVKPGDPVEVGQGVLIIEAMKMQNEVKSPRAGTVTRIGVSAEQTVAAGAELATIE